jgi:hypothetical protein
MKNSFFSFEFMRRNKLLLLGYDLQRPFSHWIGFNIFSQQEIEKERKKKKNFGKIFNLSNKGSKFEVMGKKKKHFCHF